MQPLFVLKVKMTHLVFTNKAIFVWTDILSDNYSLFNPMTKMYILVWFHYFLNSDLFQDVVQMSCMITFYRVDCKWSNIENNCFILHNFFLSFVSGLMKGLCSKFQSLYFSGSCINQSEVFVLLVYYLHWHRQLLYMTIAVAYMTFYTIHISMCMWTMRQCRLLRVTSIPNEISI
jgi:hypothetical protein